MAEKPKVGIDMALGRDVTVGHLRSRRRGIQELPREFFNFAEIEQRVLAELLSRMPREEMKRQGYIIDDTCYPPVAYKGPRFAPHDWVPVPTEAEQLILDKFINKK